MIAHLHCLVNNLFQEVFMTTPNAKIRREARAAGVPLWKIAQRLGISEPTMTRRMRVEMDPAAQEEILQIISVLSVEQKKGV
jgi:hypothetical protein